MVVMAGFASVMTMASAVLFIGAILFASNKLFVSGQALAAGFTAALLWRGALSATRSEPEARYLPIFVSASFALGGLVPLLLDHTGAQTRLAGLVETALAIRVAVYFWRNRDRFADAEETTFPSVSAALDSPADQAGPLQRS
jgi:hypothetical protein